MSPDVLTGNRLPSLENLTMGYLKGLFCDVSKNLVSSKVTFFPNKGTGGKVLIRVLINCHVNGILSIPQVVAI